MYLNEPVSAGHPSPTLKDRAKLLLGAAVYPEETSRWRRYVQSHPVLGELAPFYPRILHKIYRPWLSNHLGCRERVAALVSHYSAVSETGLGPLVRRAALVPVTLAEFAGKSGAALSLQLAAINVGHREGELALLLASEGRIAYTASFALQSADGRLQLVLGGLQGLRAADGAALIQRLTRELHGCRPKNFMVAMLRQLGASIGCDKLVLVSNRNRVVVNWRRTNRILSDYDTTWRELNAAPRSDGNFELPSLPAFCTDLALVPANKRSALRKRHALLAQAGAQAAAVLARPR